MDPGLVLEGFLMDPLERLPLVLHGLLWDYPNMQATKGGNFFTLPIFLGNIPLLESPRRDLNDQWFSLWCQTRSSLSSCPRKCSVDHSLAMSSLLRFATIKYFCTSYRLMGSFDGLSIGFRISSTASRH